MAYAWSQLQLALKTVSVADDKRAGLIRAFNKLSTLRMKDLPAEAREDFADLTDRVRVYQWERINAEEVKKHVASLSDAEITAALSKLIAMRDAVACYQPLPRQASATKKPPIFRGHSYC
jgi:DNA-binding SARP family transcriptional activator